MNERARVSPPQRKHVFLLYMAPSGHTPNTKRVETMSYPTHELLPKMGFRLCSVFYEYLPLSILYTVLYFQKPR